MHHVIITHDDGSSNEAFIDEATMEMLTIVLASRGYVLNVLSNG